jgi:hypothetical protein
MRWWSRPRRRGQGPVPAHAARATSASAFPRLFTPHPVFLGSLRSLRKNSPPSVRVPGRGEGAHLPALLRGSIRPLSAAERNGPAPQAIALGGALGPLCGSRRFRPLCCSGSIRPMAAAETWRHPTSNFSNLSLVNVGLGRATRLAPVRSPCGQPILRLEPGRAKPKTTIRQPAAPPKPASCAGEIS